MRLSNLSVPSKVISHRSGWLMTRGLGAILPRAGERELAKGHNILLNSPKSRDYRFNSNGGFQGSETPTKRISGRCRVKIAVPR